MKHMFGSKHRKVALVAGLAAAVALMSATSTRAGLISSASGNTRPFLGSTTTQGYVNFASFNKTGGVTGDTYGTGISNFDSVLTANFGANALTGAFLYLYQTVNTAATSPPLSQNSVGVDTTALIAKGILSAYRFQDNGGLVSASNPLGNTAAAAQQNSPASTGVTFSGSILTTSGAATTPSALNLGAGSLQAVYSGPTYLPANSVGSLFGYTSNLGPGVLSTGIIDGGATANGTIYGGVTVVPEPSSIVMLSIAGACGLAGLVRKRLKAKTA